MNNYNRRSVFILACMGMLVFGIVLTSLAVGFGLIEWFGWDEITPGAIAVLLGATGVGNLAFYTIARNDRQP